MEVTRNNTGTNFQTFMGINLHVLYAIKLHSSNMFADFTQDFEVSAQCDGSYQQKC